jgi:hypothetical protein
MSYLILAADPVEKKWSIVHQSEDINLALDYWNDQPKDESLRITVNTDDFITFDTEEVKDDEQKD